MRLHHARAQPAPAGAPAGYRAAATRAAIAARRRRSAARYGGVASLRRLRVGDCRPARRRGGHRGAAALPSRSHAAGARRRQARAGREAGVPAHGGLPRRSRRAIGPGAWCWSARTITTSRWRCGCARCSPASAIGEMVFAHFTTIARRLKTADDWRNDESMAGGDAFFEEGIHWLHLAGSLGPRSRRSRATGRRSRATGPDTRRQEHDGGLPLRQRRGRVRCTTRAKIPSLFEGPPAVEVLRARRHHHLRVERRCSCSRAARAFRG